MNDKPLMNQVFIIAGLSLLFGIANNFRPDAAIEWVRDWPSYQSIVAKKEEKKQADAQPEVVEEEVLDEQTLAAQTADMVTSNTGITDIDLEQARHIFKYASDFTFWIDARSPELFEEGHIQGAHLLHLYEKNVYMPEVDALIQEIQPLSLVVYCKGKDCTDSHHLAQDLEAMGYGNIFVYKDGFDDWFKAGLPIEGSLVESQPQSEEEDAGLSSESDRISEITELVTSNFGITDIGVDQASLIHQYASDFTFWIDARSPELFEKGHIKGAHLLHLYEKNIYLPDVQAKIEELAPVSLVIYCKGKDCTDSHHLAQDMQDLGYQNIFVYKDGFDDWHAANLPIEGELAAETAVAETATGDMETPAARPALEEEKPPGMYLEHVLRDMLPTLFGLFLLLTWKRTASVKMWIRTSAIFAGLFFVYAALPKIAMPMLFAKNIWNYDLVPGQVINISALWMPMLELVAAVCIITGLYRRGASFIISGLLVLFIVVVSFNVLRGHDFDCGCTASEPFWPNLYLAGWNDKFTLITRGLGLLIMSVVAFRSTGK